MRSTIFAAILTLTAVIHHAACQRLYGDLTMMFYSFHTMDPARWLSAELNKPDGEREVFSHGLFRSAV